MKYCVNYIPSLKQEIINEVAELRFDYYANKHILVETLYKFQNKKINVYINNLDHFLQAPDELEQLDILYKTYKNFTLAFTREELTEARAILINSIMQDKSIPFYFELVMGTWEYFEFFTSLNISEIFIGEALGFDLKRVRARLRAKNKHISVRAYPNVAQSSIMASPSIKKFFIRPEDMGFYQGFIDVCEFYGDINKNNVYYKIYVKDKKWLGSLNELIIDYKEPINNALITGYFALTRVDCAKRCLCGEKCHICESSIKLADNLKTAMIHNTDAPKST